MNILHCYTSTRNDLYMIRFYVRHWSRYAAKIFVYDDDSTDGTREYLESCAPLVELRRPGFHGIDEIKLQDMRSDVYRAESRGKADWITIGDSDEFHYHSDFLDALSRKRDEGYCAIVSNGFQMIGEAPDDTGQQLTDEIKIGIPDIAYSRMIFDPQLDVIWGIGHHGFAIEHGPSVRFSRRRVVFAGSNQDRFKIEKEDPEFKMLHYKYLGADYVKRRHAAAWERLSERNKMQGWGHHNAPDWQGDHSHEWIEAHSRHKRQVIE